MIIRPLAENEISAVAELEKLCFSTPWSEKSIRDSFFSDNNRFFVCEADGQLAGYIGMSVSLDEGYILNVAVHPDHRGKGFGKALVRFLIDEFGDRLSFITLEVRPSNTTAVSLYEGFGFEKVGERRNYYRNPAENALQGRGSGDERIVLRAGSRLHGDDVAGFPGEAAPLWDVHGYIGAAVFGTGNRVRSEGRHRDLFRNLCAGEGSCSERKTGENTVFHGYWNRWRVSL